MNTAPHNAPVHSSVTDAQAGRDKGFCSIHNDVRIWEYQSGVIKKHKIYKECTRCAESFKTEMQEKTKLLKSSQSDEESRKLQEAIAALEKEKLRNDQLQEGYFALFQKHEEALELQKKAEEESEAQRALAEHNQNQKIAEKEAALKRSNAAGGRDDDLDHVFKVLLIGDTGVGKSSILIQFTDGYFNNNLQSTLGVDFKVKLMDAVGLSGRLKRIKVTIWDTAGQERFRTLTSSYYRGAQAVILVYDIGRQKTFDGLSTWVTEIEQYAMGGGKDVVKLLVGNKIDLPRVVERGTAEAWASSRDMLFMECSAKTNEGIAEMFQEMVEKILQNPTLIKNTRPAKAIRKIQAAHAAKNQKCC